MVNTIFVMRMSTVNYKLVQIDFQDDGPKKIKTCKRGNKHQFLL